MGQLGQMLAGPRALLGGLCRLVGQITNITDVACDLFGNAALLLARCGDLRGHIIDALHRITGYAQRLIHARRLLHALPCPRAARMGGLDRVLHTDLQTLDHLLSILGGLLSKRGQRAHFIGYHSKTTALLACPRRLDGSV